jgi:hypothetical protein
LQRRGYALPDLGRITHQALGGFLSTGSAGGSCKWSFLDSVVSFRVIDGEGAVRVVDETRDPELFAAIGAGLGPSGIVSTLTLRAVPTFNVVGTETTSLARSAPDVDFYGDGDASRPSLARFLEQTDYARLMWWPQRDFDRLVVWTATREDPTPGFEPKPYEEVGSFSVLKQSAASLLYTVLGNLDHPDDLKRALDRLRLVGQDVGAAAKALAESIRSAPPPDPAYPLLPQEKHPWLSALAEKLLGERHPAITLDAPWTRVAEALAHMLDAIVAGALASELFAPLSELLRWAAPQLIGTILSPFSELLRWAAPQRIGTILSPFVALGEGDNPVVQRFQDVWYLGLPMDNGMDDLLMPTYFTEIWIPFTEQGGEVKRAISALRRLFDADGTKAGCYAATGPFSIELYATRGGQRFHLDPAWGDKSVFRVDVFWFGYNGGDPVKDFYPQFWEALAGFEFRLHWGKFLPTPEQLAPSKLTSRFPEFDTWKAIRAKADPSGIFLTDDWKTHLGL